MLCIVQGTFLFKVPLLTFACTIFFAMSPDIISQIVCGLWCASEVVLSTFFRSKSADPQKDKHSLLYIWISISVAIACAVALSKHNVLPICSSSTFIYLALGLILLGAAIRWLAIWQLGKYFTTDLAYDKTQELVDKGLYTFIRHPSYTGSLLSFLGLGLALNNWGSLLIIMKLVPAAFLYRIHLEEKMLAKEMGEVYKKYQRRTKKLIPFVY